MKISLQNSLENYNTSIHDINEELLIIIELLTIYNCRISEILNLRTSDIINNKFAILKGKKGSADIIIRDRFLLKLLEELKSKRDTNMFIYTSYTQAYNFIKKNYQHLITNIKKRKNNKVTHLFRYYAVANIEDEDSIKAILHHNSKKSNNYYKNKTKE